MRRRGWTAAPHVPLGTELLLCKGHMNIFREETAPGGIQKRTRYSPGDGDAVLTATPPVPSDVSGEGPLFPTASRPG